MGGGKKSPGGRCCLTVHLVLATNGEPDAASTAPASARFRLNAHTDTYAQPLAFTVSLSIRGFGGHLQRPNQLFWGTASGGGSWLADASTSPAFAIADRVGQVTASSGTFTALLGPRLANAELMVTLSISRFNGENNMGAVLHWRDTTHWYKVYLNGESLVLIKRDASQTLQLGSVPFPAQPGLRYSLLVQVRGAVILAKAWPALSSEPASWELRVADQSATWFSGYGGLRMYYLSRGSVTTTVAFFRETRTL